jgi:hypothetical protein
VLVAGKLEFLGTNDREHEIDDQENGDDSYNGVSHGLLVGFEV